MPYIVAIQWADTLSSATDVECFGVKWTTLSANY